MAKKGLVLRPTDRTTTEQIGRRQPDWLLISSEVKRNAIPDLCRPSDILPSQASLHWRIQCPNHSHDESLNHLDWNKTFGGEKWI